MYIYIQHKKIQVVTGHVCFSSLQARPNSLAMRRHAMKPDAASRPPPTYSMPACMVHLSVGNFFLLPRFFFAVFRCVVVHGLAFQYDLAYVISLP